MVLFISSLRFCIICDYAGNKGGKFYYREIQRKKLFNKNTNEPVTKNQNNCTDETISPLKTPILIENKSLRYTSL